MKKSVIFALPFMLMASPVFAGPFFTDDAGTEGKGNVKVEVQSTATRTTNTWGGNYGSLEATYGVTDNFDISVGAPLTFTKTDNKPSINKFGDVELEAKFKFYENGPFSVAIAPSVTVPVINSSSTVTVPVWATYEISKTVRVSSGGGYTVDFNKDANNTQFVGVLAEYDVNDRVTVGTEVYHLFQNVADTTVGAGVTYKVTNHSKVYAYVSTGVQNEQTNNEFTARAGYKLTF